MSPLDENFESLVFLALVASQNIGMISGTIFQNVKIVDEIMFKKYGVHVYLSANENQPDRNKIYYSLVFQGVDEEQNKIIKNVTNNILNLVDENFSIIGS